MMAKLLYADEFEASLKSQITAIAATGEPASRADTPMSSHEPGVEDTSMCRRSVGQPFADVLAISLATISILLLVTVITGLSLNPRMLLGFTTEMALLGARRVNRSHTPSWIARAVSMLAWAFLLASALFLAVVSVQGVAQVVQEAQSGDAQAAWALMSVAITGIVLSIPVILGHSSLIASLRPSTSRVRGRGLIIVGLAVIALVAVSEYIVATTVLQSASDGSLSPFEYYYFLNTVKGVTVLGAGLMLAQLVVWDTVLARSSALARTWQWLVEIIAIGVISACISLIAPSATQPLLIRLGFIIPVGLLVVAAVVRPGRAQVFAHSAAVLALLLVPPNIARIDLVVVLLILWLPAVLTRSTRLATIIELGFPLYIILVTQFVYYSANPLAVFSLIVIGFLLALAQGALLAALRAQFGRDVSAPRNSTSFLTVAVAFGILTLVVLLGACVLTFESVQVVASRRLDATLLSVLLLLDLLLWVLEISLVVSAGTVLVHWVRGRQSTDTIAGTEPPDTNMEALHVQIERLSTLAEWMSEDPELRTMVDKSIGRQVAASERRQRIYSATLGIVSLIVGWLLSLFATTDSLAHVAQLLTR
jgi:hypothetical protein